MNKLFGKLAERFKGAEIVAGAIAALVLFAVAYNLIFSAAGTATRGLQKKVAVEEAELRRLLGFARDREAINGEYAKVRQYLTVPASEQETMTRVLKEVERLTQEGGVTVVSLLPSHEFTQDARSRRYRFDLQIEGDMKQVLWFLSKIQESKYLLMVDSFALQPKGEGSSLLRLDAALSFLEYASRR